MHWAPIISYFAKQQKDRDKPGTLKNVQSTPSFKPFRSGAHTSDRVALGCFSPAGNKEEFLLLF